MKKEQKQLNMQKEYGKVKGAKKTSWEIIVDMNKLYKVDRILLKEAYEAYPKKDQLEKSNEYNLIEKFYRYTFDNLDEIERKYLNSGDLNENQYSTYLINKNSTSKFVRDQNEHYQKVFKKHAQKINQDEMGINGQKMYNFIKECFDTKYTEIMFEGGKYFDKVKADSIEAIVKNYYTNVKEVAEKDFVIANAWLEEQEILDFLSFWLKEFEDQDFYVLYCRTEEKLKKQMQYLANRGEKKRKVHPSIAHKVQAEGELNEQEEKNEQKNQEKKEQEGEGKQPEENEEKEEKSETKEEKIIQNNQSILQKYRKNKISDEQIKIEEPKKKLSKKEFFQSKLAELFSYGCKRRYPLPAGRTFDQIQAETKNMNMEKFINFCSHFQIMEHMSRQLLMEFFKMYALNRLILDLKRFKNLMNRMAESDDRIIDKFTAKFKNRKGARSDYKFTLRPMNGKDVESLEYELQQIKFQKSRSKNEKLQMYYAKKQNLLYPKHEKKERSQLSTYVLPERTNILELQKVRDGNFDLQDFIGKDNDELLNDYQSKVWGKEKQKKEEGSRLEAALSVRMEKGRKILKKMTNKNLKQYS